MRNRIGVCLMSGTSCLVLAALWAALAAPGTAVAAKGGQPGGGGGGGGGSKTERIAVCVEFRDGPSDRITSDVGVVYCHSSTDRGKSLLALVTTGGASPRFILNSDGTKDKGDRVIVLDFSECHDNDLFPCDATKRAHYGYVAEDRLGILL